MNYYTNIEMENFTQINGKIDFLRVHILQHGDGLPPGQIPHSATAVGEC